jgi:endonuclease/exonuclease/phosphatase family metal-dependent hydrolase
MKIISSNIRFDNPADGLNAWPNRKIFLSRLLNKYKPDVIGTQEGRQLQIKELSFLLKDKKLVESHRSWIAERMYPCLFVNESTEVIESFDLWLSNTPEVPGTKLDSSAFPRLATIAKVLWKGNLVLLANMHLDHTLDEVREDQINIFINEIKKLEFDGPLIVCGDFNSRVEKVVYKKILNDLSLIDPWKSHSLSEETSFHQFKGTLEIGHRIDWILHSKHFVCNEIKLLKESDNGLFPSDHYPIFCDIILKN